jgi:hypothetical protein
MIIQKVAKGLKLSPQCEQSIAHLDTNNPYLSAEDRRNEYMKIILTTDIQTRFERGILCNWWLHEQRHILPVNEIPKRLTEENLYWHQNKYSSIHPSTGRPFSEQTPFISTTAGTVERQYFLRTNRIHDASTTAMQFATKNGRQTGIVFFCYVFIIGKKSIGHQGLAEELRELNIYTRYSPWHNQGEIAAKIIIPPAQIAGAEVWLNLDFQYARNNGKSLRQAIFVPNPTYLKPDDYHNIRELLDSL